MTQKEHYPYIHPTLILNLNIAKETIPYNMKDTGQRINALDDMNNLINGITDMSKQKYFIIK
jgi:hypothetical protein